MSKPESNREPRESVMVDQPDVETIEQIRRSLDNNDPVGPDGRDRIRLALAIDLVVFSNVSITRAAGMTGIDPTDLLLALESRSIPPENLPNPTETGRVAVTKRIDGTSVGTERLSVIMPCYNERNTLLEIVRRVRSVEIPKEIIIVDDCSKDGTRELLKSEIDGKLDGVRVVYHDRNQGKGAALRTGFQQATGTILLIQDADLEYNPEEYPRLIEPILSGHADVVYGSRFAGGSHRVHLYWHSVGNRFLTSLSNMLTNLNLTDMETCYKVFRAEVLHDIRIRQNRFGFEPEITAKIAKKRARVYEVPISYHGRDYTEGKKIGWKDGLQAIWCIMKYRFTE